VAVVFLSWFAFVCLIGAELAQLSTGVVTRWPLPLISPQVGIMTAALLLMPGRRRAMALPIASVITAVVMIGGYSLPAAPSILLCGIAALEACAAAALLRLILHPRAAFRRVEDLWLLALVAAIVPLAGGTLAAVTLTTLAGEPSFRNAFIEWWVPEVAGMIFVVPIGYGMAFARDGVVATLRSWRGLEGAFVVAATCLVAYAVFGDWLPETLRLPLYLLPLLLWACLRLDLAGTSLVMLAASMIAITYTAHGKGPYASELPVAANTLRAQGGLVVAGLFFPMLALIVSERKRILRDRERLVSELQQALLEVKTLQGMIPICAWCHKIRDDEGFWQGVDTYLQDKVDATFSHAICPSCSAEQHERYGLTRQAAGTTRDR